MTSLSSFFALPVGRYPVVALALVAASALMTPALAGPAGPLTWGSNITIKSSSAGWVRLVKLSNGNWLAVYAIFPSSGSTYLEIARSTDNARSWTPISTISESGRNLDNGNLIQLPNGTVLVTMRSVVDGQSYRLPVYRSTDDGASWAYLSNIDANESPNGATNRGVWEPTFNNLSNGTLSVLYANEKHAGDNPGYSQIISQKTSTDNGATWSSESRAITQSGGGSARPGMPVMTRMNDGRWIMVYEICNDPNGGSSCNVYRQISSNGTSWPSGLGIRVRNQICGPHIIFLTDGRLLATSCENNDSYSNDFGANWMKNDPSAVSGFSFRWPAYFQTGSSEIVRAANLDSGVGLRLATIAAPLSGSTNFSDDFNDNNDAGWTPYGRNTSVSGGQYRIDNAPNNGNSSTTVLAGDDSYTSGSLEADVTLTSDNNAGLMIRTTNAGPGADEADGYYAGIDSAGRVVLGKQANGWTQLASTAMTINQNTTYKMKVTAEGSSIQVFVSDMTTPKISVTDSSFSRGQFGVRSYLSNAVYDNIAFTRSTSTYDFSSGFDSGWTRYGGNFSVVDSTYQASNSGTTAKSVWGTTSSDMTFEGDVRITGGAGDAGLIFRASNFGTGADDMNGYYAGLNESGNALILGRQNGNWTELAAVGLTVDANVTYKMKIVAIGSDIRVYVNDMNTPKLHVTDSTWGSGSVGVRTHFSNAVFDNMAVTK